MIEAEIPFYTLNYWFVTVFEIFLGMIILLGYYSRIGALMALPLMFVAIYVHLTVSNPAAFPAQPQEPYIPIAVITMALIVIKKGGGNWSMDLKSFNKGSWSSIKLAYQYLADSIKNIYWDFDLDDAEKACGYKRFCSFLVEQLFKISSVVGSIDKITGCW